MPQHDTHIDTARFHALIATDTVRARDLSTASDVAIIADPHAGIRIRRAIRKQTQRDPCSARDVTQTQAPARALTT